MQVKFKRQVKRAGTSPFPDYHVKPDLNKQPGCLDFTVNLVTIETTNHEPMPMFPRATPIVPAKSVEIDAVVVATRT